MKKCQKPIKGIVKIDVGSYPAVSSLKTCSFVGYHSCVIFNTMLINALEEFPAKKIDSHNAEYQPEHDANKKNIGDTRYCMKQRAYYHLKDSIRTV